MVFAFTCVRIIGLLVGPSGRLWLMSNRGEWVSREWSGKMCLGACVVVVVVDGIVFICLL